MAGVVRVIDRFPGHRTPPDLTGIDLHDYVDHQYALRAVNGEDSPSGSRIPGSGVAEETGAAAATKSLATARATIMDISRRWQSEALLEIRGCRR